tara:strand:- start:36 stop:812 length:777 start_codon:yes stop_codon:yes gene_type:complete
MPDEITISQQPTGSVDEQSQAAVENLEQAAAELQKEGNLPEEQELIGGEFETQEDLLAAYNELKATREQEEPQQMGTAQEIYGETIGNILEQGNVNYQSMNEYWQENGSITDAHYKELEQAGIPREMVDLHLGGLKDQYQVTTSQIYAIRDSYGENNFANMQEWAATNLTDAEKKAYSSGINSTNIEQVKLTVAGLHARYVASVGNEPTLLSGRPASGSADKFESVAQLEEAMNDPRYAKDEAYRSRVEDKLGRSNIF